MRRLPQGGALPGLTPSRQHGCQEVTGRSLPGIPLRESGTPSRPAPHPHHTEHQRLHTASTEPGHRPDASTSAIIRSPGPGRSLWLVRGDEGYGVRRALLGMAHELRGRGIAIAFAALHEGAFAEEIREAGYTVRILTGERQPGAITRRGFAFLGGVLLVFLRARAQRSLLVDAVREIDADWIHFRSNSLLILAGMAAHACGIPAYWHLPNTITRKIPFGLQALGYRLLCRVWGVHPLANSRHTAASLGRGLVPVRVLYPGIDASHFSPDARFARLDRSELGLAPDRPVFVVCARLVEEKAQDRVIAAACELRRAGEELTLLIVGGPVGTPFHERLVELIRSESAGDFVRLTGPVSDPRPYLEIADVVINSRTGPEPFGLSIVEAMLMERPVLAYGLGGPAETVEAGTTGWLITDPTVAGYARGLRRALGDSPRWSAMGREGRRRATAHFSVQQTASTYLDMVLRQDARPTAPDAMIQGPRHPSAPGAATRHG